MSVPPDTPPRRVPRPVTLAYLERAALYYLERYASSSGNLRRVLLRKVDRRCRERGEEATAETTALVDEVVRKAVSGGYLDDRSYAAGRVAALRRRGGSARGIAAKLQAKGVDRDLIETALAAEDTDETAAALALARRRRLGPFRTRDRAAHRDRDLAAMARGGFSFDVARRVVDGDGTVEA